MVELIPGTSLPVYAPGSTQQVEGRGEIALNPSRAPVSLMERIASRDDVTPQELAVLDAAMRRYDESPKYERTIYVTQADATDPTTGNCVLPLFDVPQGMEGHVTRVNVDVPSSSTITPSSPFSTAGVFAYLSVAPPTTSDDDGIVVSPGGMRFGMVAFAPVTSGGPVLPGEWTYNDSNAPVIWGGQTIHWVLVGASNASLTNIGIQVKARINLYSRSKVAGQ